MKLRKLLMLFPAVLTLSACGKTQPESQPESQSGSESQPETKSDTDSESMAENFKKIGEDMAYIAASKTKTTKSLQPMSEQDKKIELVMPSVMTYLTGKLYENEGFDCLDKVVKFSEVFDLKFGGSSEATVMDISLSLMVNVDSDNNKIKFNGFQDSIQGESPYQMVVKSHIYIEIDYNFETKALGDFKMWAKGGNTQPGSEVFNESFSYSEYIGGVAKKLDMNTKDEEYEAREAEIDAVLVSFNEKVATQTVADAATARKYGEGYIATQNFVNGVVGQELDTEFHNK